MTTLDVIDLATVTGGAARVAAPGVDTATQDAIKKLATDVKDLARAPQNQSSQLTTLFTVAVMSRLANR